MRRDEGTRVTTSLRGDIIWFINCLAIVFTAIPIRVKTLKNFILRTTTMILGKENQMANKEQGKNKEKKKKKKEKPKKK